MNIFHISSLFNTFYDKILTEVNLVKGKKDFALLDAKYYDVNNLFIYTDFFKLNTIDFKDEKTNNLILTYNKLLNNFRKNIEEGYFPISTDITYNGLFYDYSFLFDFLMCL